MKRKIFFFFLILISLSSAIQTATAKENFSDKITDFIGSTNNLLILLMLITIVVGLYAFFNYLKPNSKNNKTEAYNGKNDNTQDPKSNYKSTIPPRSEFIGEKQVNLKIFDGASNTPISNATVKVFQDENSINPKQTEPSNLEGSISFKTQYKDFVLEVNHRDYVQLKKKCTQSDQKILLSRKKGSISVQLEKEGLDPALIKEIDLSGVVIRVTNAISEYDNKKETDVSGKVLFEKVPTGEYKIQFENDIIELDCASVLVEENKEMPVKLKIKYKYKTEPRSMERLREIQEVLDKSYNEVSTYDTCIPAYLLKIGKNPLGFSSQIMNGETYQLYFLRTNFNPAEFVNIVLDVAEGLAREIAFIIRDKYNIDLYAEAMKLQKIEKVDLSEYSIEEFKNLLRKPDDYSQSNFDKVKHKLEELDRDITQKSSELTISPVADLWAVSNRLMSECIRESDHKKQGIMIFMLNMILINLEQMFHSEDVIKRLKLTVF